MGIFGSGPRIQRIAKPHKPLTTSRRQAQKNRSKIIGGAAVLVLGAAGGLSYSTGALSSNSGDLNHNVTVADTSFSPEYTDSTTVPNFTTRPQWLDGADDRYYTQELMPPEFFSYDVPGSIDQVADRTPIASPRTYFFADTTSSEQSLFSIENMFGRSHQDSEETAALNYSYNEERTVSKLTREQKHLAYSSLLEEAFDASTPTEQLLAPKTILPNNNILPAFEYSSVRTDIANVLTSKDSYSGISYSFLSDYGRSQQQPFDWKPTITQAPDWLPVKASLQEGPVFHDVQWGETFYSLVRKKLAEEYGKNVPERLVIERVQESARLSEEAGLLKKPGVPDYVQAGQQIILSF